jgi:hypothetical protein
VSRSRSDPPKRKLLKFSKLHRTAKQPEQQQPKATMEMSMVYKAMPRNIFEDILTRFKSCQACKKDCMVEYMTSEMSGYACYCGTEWCRHLLTNEEADDNGCQQSLDAKLEKRMNSALRDMRYTFYSMMEDKYYLSKDECNYSYDSDYDYESDGYLEDSDDKYVEDSDEE